MKKQKTFTMEEVMEMIDDAMRNVKGGDDYPTIDSEQYEEFKMYSPGISFLKGWLKTCMIYEMTGKFPDLK